jgi:hypothetical protein
MKIDIFIDNNVWDILWNQNVDLEVELPCEEFNLKMTREAEFEIPKMPDEKRNYVEKYIAKKIIKTDLSFGFYDESISSEDQRNGGFGDIFDPEVGGTFLASDQEQLIKSEIIGPSKRPTGLLKNEADVSLAAISLHSFVITCDGKKALKRAKKENGKIIDLKKYSVGTSLYSFIKTEIDLLNV